jgi:hypothetical protein
MIILDIDMDFFLNNVPHDISSSSLSRVNDEDYVPWNRTQVVNFLEESLGLSKKHKINGKIVTHHNEALYYWRELVLNSKIEVPFEVIHIDSHADLGLGSGSWVFIFEKLLGLDVDKRYDIENYKNYFDKYREPDIGDYLLFAIAFRWISSLTYICNPDEDGNDYIWYILKDLKEPNNKIQLPYNNQYPAIDLNDTYKRKIYLKSSILEPEIPFNIINNLNYVSYNGQFDYISFCISPNYTPKSADFIIDIIREYIV